MKDVGDPGDSEVEIWGYPTLRTKWCLALVKEGNSVNKWPIFIRENVLRVSE